MCADRKTDIGPPHYEQFLPEVIKKNYGKWDYHEILEPGVMVHVGESGDKLFTVRAASPRILSVKTLRNFADLADSLGGGIGLENAHTFAMVRDLVDEIVLLDEAQIAAGIRTPTVDGRTPSEQVAECQVVIREIGAQQDRVYRQLLGALDAQGIRLVKYNELEPVKRDALREQFITNIFPLLTPLALDPAHPFPLISNLALNLLVALRHPGGSAIHIARVKVPVARDMASRFLRVGDEDVFVTQDDVIANNLDLLFPGMDIVSCELFRVTRNAIVEIEEEEADDLLAMIETELRHRHFAPIVRLEVYKGMDPTHRGMLAAELGLNEEADVFEVEELMAMRDLFEIAGLEISALHDPPHVPVTHPRLRQLDLVDSAEIFAEIRRRH